MKNRFLIFVLLILISCNIKRYSFNKLQEIGVFETSVTVKKIVHEGKQIAFIKTRHIGKKEYYDQMKIKIDSLKNDNYYFFLEGVQNKSNDTIQLLKYRKIFGNIYTNNAEEIIDTINNKIYNIVPYDKEWGLISQPRYGKFGLDSLNSKIVDIDVAELVNLYEEKFQKIELDSCDYSTSLNDKYDCKRKIERKNWNEFSTDYIITYRDMNVANKIKESDKKKICIIYGQNHYEGIKNHLDNSSATD